MRSPRFSINKNKKLIPFVLVTARNAIRWTWRLFHQLHTYQPTSSACRVFQNNTYTQVFQKHARRTNATDLSHIFVLETLDELSRGVVVRHRVQNARLGQNLPRWKTCPGGPDAQRQENGNSRVSKDLTEKALTQQHVYSSIQTTTKVRKVQPAAGKI